MKKFLAFLLVLFSVVVLAGCGKEKIEPTNAFQSVVVGGVERVLKFKKHEARDLIFKSSNPAVLEVDEQGKLIPKQPGLVTIAVTLKKNKNVSVKIRISVRAKSTKPDLGGYKISIAQADHAIHEVDPRMTEYTAPDKEFKKAAWERVEEEYNCKIAVEPYPASAPWGEARWSYIVNQAQSQRADYDFYIVPETYIPRFVQGGAILNLKDWDTQYGNDYMHSVYRTSGTYKKGLYNINGGKPGVDNGLFMNVGLFEKIKDQVGGKSPAELYMEGVWTFSRFKEFLKAAHGALQSLENDKYVAASGNPVYYWVGLCNAAGVQMVNPATAEVNLNDPRCGEVADFLKDLATSKYLENAISVDQHDKKWNKGESLIASGDLWFVNTPNRWPKDIWGEDTRFGFVPFPRPDKVTVEGVARDSRIEDQKYGVAASTCLVMPVHRKFTGEYAHVSSELVYRAMVDSIIYTEQNRLASPDGQKQAELVADRKFAGDESSKRAFIHVDNALKDQNQSFFEGLATPSNPIFNTGDTASEKNQFTKALFYYIISKDDANIQLKSTYLETLQPYLEKFKTIAQDIYS